MMYMYDAVVGRRSLQASLRDLEKNCRIGLFKYFGTSCLILLDETRAGRALQRHFGAPAAKG